MKGVYLPSVSDWGLWRETPLEVVSDNHSPAPIYVRQWDIVVLNSHLVLLVLAALVICVGYMCVFWCLTGTWCCKCLMPWHMCWLYVGMVVLDRHLGVCVGYMFVCAVLVFSVWCIVAICEVGCLACT